MSQKKPAFKPPANPREALKRLNGVLGKLWNKKENEPVNYVKEARLYVKYLEGFVMLIEKTTDLDSTKIEVEHIDEPVKNDSLKPEVSNTHTEV